jgi:hypothetical protein
MSDLTARRQSHRRCRPHIEGRPLKDHPEAYRVSRTHESYTHLIRMTRKMAWFRRLLLPQHLGMQSSIISESDQPDPPMTSRQVKPQGVAHPSRSARRRPERLPLLEHFRLLEISGQVVDRMGEPVEAGDHDEQREENARFHAVVLRTPCSSHERRRQSANVRSPRRLDLGKISTEITDDVSAAEVGRQPPKRTSALTPRAGQEARAVLGRCGPSSRRAPGGPRSRQRAGRSAILGARGLRAATVAARPAPGGPGARSCST